MLVIQRRELIKNQIEEIGEVLVAELSKELNVSETTIRRDLDFLENQQIVMKTYGGAVLHDNYSLKSEPLFSDRSVTNNVQKNHIAKSAASLINDGDVIILDNGTTSSLIVNYLQAKKDLTIITNSIPIAYNLMASEHIDVIVLGGQLRKRTGAIVGNSTILSLQSMYADKVFLSCSGVSIEGGVTVSNMNSMALRKQMMESSQTTILLADSSKIGKRSISKICSLNEITSLVTDTNFEEQKQFEELGIEVMVANENQEDCL
ncbi:DeoR/GlpR family DNA-binding transcription regulator [Paenisporosarcina indica]|uniref:DeoR/GlpR family DNA-binding transcription regulator n=1 Tax=Paenisporosarcina indica TaxID=650093 RepID=UPI00094FF20A|nr:DeoR/GlpR family DNA-binding transcription regulator [Paenisporosarcina indica]